MTTYFVVALLIILSSTPGLSLKSFHFKMNNNHDLHKQSSCLMFQLQRNLVCLLLDET